jgi:hypothetical protein
MSSPLFNYINDLISRLNTIIINRNFKHINVNDNHTYKNNDIDEDLKELINMSTHISNGGGLTKKDITHVYSIEKYYFPDSDS